LAGWLFAAALPFALALAAEERAFSVLGSVGFSVRRGFPPAAGALDLGMDQGLGPDFAKVGYQIANVEESD